MPIVERIDLSNHPGRVFVVGDLHGMAHALERILSLAGFDPEADLLWSLGDLVDRGPFSHRCLELLEQPWFRALRGNHEQLMLESGDDYGTWLQWTINGGEWSVGYPWDDPALVRRLAGLPWAAELRTNRGLIGLVHADIDRTRRWSDFLAALEDDRGMARRTALWSRASASQAMRGEPGLRVEDLDLLLVGHSIVPEPFQWGNLWFLDSGAVVSESPSAALSMLEIHPTLELWSLPTAGDPVATQWWDGLSERLSGVLDRIRGEDRRGETDEPPSEIRQG